MAYLPSDVIEKLKKEADKGNEYAQGVLDKTGNYDKKEEPTITQQSTVQPFFNPSLPAQENTAQPILEWNVQTLSKNAEDNKQTLIDKAKQEEDALFRMIEDRSKQNKDKMQESLRAKTIKDNAISMNLDDELMLKGEKSADIIDKQSAKFTVDAKYKVKTVDVSNIDFAQGDVELWCISDTQRGVRTSADLNGQVYIGRNNLEGANKDDNYVIYNKNTHELYQYSKDEQQKDARERLQKAKDEVDIERMSIQQNSADWARAKQSVYQSLMDTVRDYHINLYGDMSDDELAVIQPLIDLYSKYDTNLENTITNGDKRLTTLQNRVDTLEQYKQGTGSNSVNDYAVQKAILNKYTDIQAVYSGDMTGTAFKEKYGQLPSTTLLNKCAQEAQAATNILEHMNGTLYDDLGIADECNSMANDLLLQDDIARKAVIANAEKASDVFDMSDKKQINSLIDVYRKAFVTVCLDNKGDWAGKLKAIPNVIKDSAEYWDKVKKTVSLSKDEDNINTGLSGVLLSWMSDAGDLLGALGSAAFDAAGLSGKHTKTINAFGPNGMYKTTSVIENSFKEGVLSNADYYTSRAKSYDDSNNNLGAFFNNYGLVLEAYARGDLDAEFDFTKVQSIANGVDTTAQIEEHPLVVMATNIGMSMALDPTTYLGGAADKIMANAIPDELVSKYSDDLIKTLKRFDIDENLIDADKINKIVKNECVSAVKEGRTKFDDTALMRVINDYITPLNTNITQESRIAYVDNLFRESKEAIEAISTSEVAKLWEDSAKIMKTGKTLKDIDNALNAFQLGPVAALLPGLKQIKFGLTKLADSDVVKNSTKCIANYLNQMCYNVTKFADKGSDGIKEFDKLQNAFKASFNLDIIEDAIKNGDRTALDLDEFNKISDNLRTEYAKGIIGRELDSINKSIGASIGITDLLKNSATPSTVADLAESVAKHNTITSDTLNDIIVTLTNGKHIKYGEYIDNLRDIAKTVDSPNAGFKVATEIESKVNKLETVVNTYNSCVVREKIRLANACVLDGTEAAIAILKTIDVSDIAPELQEQLSSIAMFDEDSIEAIKKLVNEYTDAYGATVSKKQFRIFKNSMEVSDAVRAGRYVTPEQYINHCLTNAGVQPVDDVYKSIIKDSVSKYGDMELAGKLYEFIESSESNMNGILQNKSLRSLLDDTDILETLRREGLDTELRNIANLDAVDIFEYVMYESFDPEAYHAIMDTVSGSYAVINDLARQYKANPHMADTILDSCVNYIKSHNANTIAQSADRLYIETAEDISTLRAALTILFDDMPDDCLTVIPTRDQVYSTLMAINDKVVNHLDPDVQAISSKIEKAIEDGAYTTCNNELGKVLYNESLNKYITDVAGLPKEYHINHMKNIADFIVNGESVQLKTLIDLDVTKQFIPDDLIKKCLDKGNIITQELNEYTASLSTLYSKFEECVPKLSADDLESFRTVINNMSKSLTSPAELRYLEYFNSIEFTDKAKAFSAVVDITARLGIDLDKATDIVTFKNPGILNIISDYADNLYMYAPKGDRSKDIIKLNNLVQKQLTDVADIEHGLIPTLYSKEHNSFKMREELYNALGITDGATRASLYKKQEISDDIFYRYSSINNTGCTPNYAINQLRKMENNQWEKNVQNVMSWDKETLDKALLCTHSNAIVCDVNRYPELAKWLIEREADGYIVTCTQLGGTSVHVLSMDFNACTPEYKKYLRELGYSDNTLERVSSVDKLKDERDKFYASVQNTTAACSEKFANTNFMYSSNYSKVNMDFHNQLQQLIPEQCRLDAEFTKLHNNAFCGNMLVDHELSNSLGATKGHLLGNCYYAECAELNNLDSLGTVEDILKVNNNSVQYWMDHNVTDTYGGKSGFEYLYKQIKDSGYHIVSMDSSDVADVGKKYKLTDVTELYNYNNYTTAEKLNNSVVNSSIDYTAALTGKEHYIVDDLTYKYLNGEINANNRMMQYYTTPKLMQQAMDVVDNYRSAIVTGLLYASNVQGTGFRNIIDSNTKALAEVGLANSAEYMGNWYRALDAKQSYVEQMARIFDETGKQGVQGINEYIEKHIDDLDFDAKELMLNHTIFTLNEMDDEVASKCAEIYNNKLLDSCTFAIDKESKDKIIKAFNATRDKHWLDKNYRTPEQMEEFLRTELTKALADKHSVNADEQISELTKLFGKWRTGNAEHWYTKMFNDNNIIGRNLSAINKNTFDNAETRCRYALMRTLMDRGESSSEAIRKVVKTQFDYGTQRGLAGGWDKIMPFAKYQFANAAYWLDCTNYSSFTLANMRRMTYATCPLQSNTDAIKTAIAIAYYKRKNDTEENTSTGVDDTKSFFEATISDVIDNYKGVKAANAEGVSIDNHHYLKIGNGFVETIEWIGKVLNAPGELAKGEIPTVLKDTVFGPVKVLPTAVPKILKYVCNPDDKDAYTDLYNYLKGYIGTDGKYVYGQMSNLIGCVPVFGQLFNMCCTVAKNVVANNNLLALTMCSTGCTESLLTSLSVQASALGFGILNSVIGTRKDSGTFGKRIFTPYTDENGVRHTWSQLTNEEKAKYTYLDGISNDRMWALTPSDRYGLYGRLAEAGLDKRAISMLTSRWLCKNPAFKIADGDNVYTDTVALEAVVMDMLEQGYTVGEITYLITMTDRWYDVRTHKIIKSDAEMQRYFMNQAFLKEYELIPDYIKYQPDMYSEMMSMYKTMGLTTREAWQLMRTEGAYIDENGQLRTLTADQAGSYNKWLRDEYYAGQEDDGFLEWYNTLPDYIQYEKGAYSRTLAYLKQMFSADEAKQMIANGAYYTVDGRLINCKDLHRAKGHTNTVFQDAAGYWHKEGDFQVNGYWFHKGDNPYLGYKDFTDYYKHLPQYTQYTKGCFKTTNSVLKTAGFDYNTRMQAMLDGAIAIEMDPNSEAFKAMLVKQQIVAVTKTVYVDKQVPLRECTIVDGKYVWNGPQIVKVDNLGNGYTIEQGLKEMEFNAAVLGITKENKWKAYDAAMVTVKVPQTVVSTEQDPNQIMYRIVNHDGNTYVIVPAPDYIKPKGGYYKKGSPKSWTKRRYSKKQYEKIKRLKGGYYYNNQPMHIKYSNVRTYSKQHFLTQQSEGYKYWTQWGDGNMTNHHNRNGRMHFPSTYRNPRAKQRSIYKDMYAKFGASRINARQNIAGYSNASITRLRRNDIANRSYNIKVNSARV